MEKVNVQDKAVVAHDALNDLYNVIYAKNNHAQMCGKLDEAVKHSSRCEKIYVAIWIVRGILKEEVLEDDEEQKRRQKRRCEKLG